MNRLHIILIASLMALCGSLTAWGMSAAQRDYDLRGYVDPTQSADLPYRVPRLGVNADLTLYADPEAELKHMEAAGFTWVRQRILWREIERKAGVYSWDTWDRIIPLFEKFPSLRLVAVLFESPEWSRSRGGATAPPSDPAAFARFAAAFAERYGAWVDHYQIWDEPNLTAAWGGLPPEPAAYLALLSAAYRAIHAADAGAAVIMAALAPTTERTERNISDLDYLTRLYDLGVSAYMDAAAAKPYGFDSSPLDRAVSADILNFSRIIALREVMTAHGDGRKALWASEWGWNALPSNWSGAPSIWGSVTPEQQIAYTQQAIQRAEREWAWLGGMILESWQPNAPPDDPRWGFALIDPSGSPKALLQAVEGMETTAASNGLYFPTTPHARYSGVWTFGELGADIGWVQDSRAAFDFFGSDIALLLRRDNYLAFLYLTIDGRPPNATPVDPDGRGFIALRSADLTPSLDLIPAARGLPVQKHTLEITADRGWDRWALAGFAVSSGDLAAPYNRQISAAILTTFLSAAAAAAAAVQIDWKPLALRLSAVWNALNAAGQLSISFITSAALMLGMFLTWRESAPALFTREPVQLGLALITAGVLYLQPHVIIVVLAAAALFWIIYHRLDYGLMLALLYAPFFLFPVELARFAFPMTELIILITACAAAARGLAAWGLIRQTSISGFSPRIRLSALDLALIGWLGISALSLSWASHRAPALTELRTLIIEPALFYAVFRLLPRDTRIDLRLVDSLIASGALVAVVGLIMYANGQGIITAEGGSARLAGVYGSPNNVGLILGRCIPFALAFLLIRVDQRRRLLAGAALIPMAAALLLSQSAGALFIGVPSALGGVILLVFGRRALAPLLGLASAGAALIAAALQSARFERLLDFAQGTTFFRIRVWASALQAIRDHPVTGLGLDQFLYAFQGRYMMPDAWQEPSLSHPHNFILDIWTRLGLLGLAVFAGMQAAFWHAMRRACLSARSQPLAFAIIVGAMGSMIDLLAHGLIDNSIFVTDLAVVFAFLLGIAARCSAAFTDSISKAM
jgi:O-antigen ligase